MNQKPHSKMSLSANVKLLVFQTKESVQQDDEMLLCPRNKSCHGLQLHPSAAAHYHV